VFDARRFRPRALRVAPDPLELAQGARASQAGKRAQPIPAGSGPTAGRFLGPQLLQVARPHVPQPGDAQVRDHVTKGVAGGHLFFTTDDCRKTYKELKARGVEFTEEPTERPYGIDCGLRDPFGNHIRFSQPTTTP